MRRPRNDCLDQRVEELLNGIWTKGGEESVGTVWFRQTYLRSPIEADNALYTYLGTFEPEQSRGSPSFVAKVVSH